MKKDWVKRFNAGFTFIGMLLALAVIAFLVYKSINLYLVAFQYLIMQNARVGYE